jgi:glycine/D-amino acid oxidase-like deaminating enzyme
MGRARTTSQRYSRRSSQRHSQRQSRHHSPSDYSGLSLWHATADDLFTPRPSLAEATHSDRAVDVAIVGAGYTGLWTAYYLHRADPSLRIAVVESEVAGFGASGRNGGWCSALFPVSLSALSREHGRHAAVRQYRAMQEAVSEVERAVAADGLAVDFARGGTITLARTAPQLERARAEVDEAAEFGFSTEDIALVDAHAARKRLNATSVLGGVYTPHCAAIHPAKLVRSLASLLSANGVPIYEHTRALSIEPGRVQTEHGDLRAEIVVRATEGFTPRLRGHARAVAPVYSLVIATEPLSSSLWDEIGLAERETFADFRHLIIYGQRTADHRLVFGGRGAPYHFGSRIAPKYDRVPAVFNALRSTLSELLPVTRSASITHQWGGPLGIARDWHASVGLDRTTGIGWAGGYVGDGVSTTNLAGRTLTDLILGRDSELTALPWVNHRSPQWEPEPLRWLGANAGLRAMSWADAAEQRHGRQSRAAAVVNRMLGR